MTMQIKGTAVKSIGDYVRKQHPTRYNEWLTSLPLSSYKLLKDGVNVAEWYPMHDAAIIPTSKVGELFFHDPKKGAWECGRYSAENALTGVYKLYVKFASPGHIIERASRVFAAYYQPCELVAANFKPKSVEVIIKKMSQPHPIIEHRIGGWMERALEISGCSGIKITIPKSLTNGATETVFAISWD
jgi:hypothetical protein